MQLQVLKRKYCCANRSIDLKFKKLQEEYKKMPVAQQLGIKKSQSCARINVKAWRQSEKSRLLDLESLQFVDSDNFWNSLVEECRRGEKQ